MISTPNWGRLYAQGRCKAIGVPWTTEESLAVFNKVIPAPYVRLGILSVTEYEKRKAKEEKTKEIPLLVRSKDELLLLAHKKGIPATSGADVETLVSLIERKGKPLPKPEPVHEPIVEPVVEEPKEEPKVEKKVEKPKKKGKKDEKK